MFSCGLGFTLQCYDSPNRLRSKCEYIQFFFVFSTFYGTDTIHSTILHITAVGLILLSLFWINLLWSIIIYKSVVCFIGPTAETELPMQFEFSCLFFRY